MLRKCLEADTTTANLSYSQDLDFMRTLISFLKYNYYFLKKSVFINNEYYLSFIHHNLLKTFVAALSKALSGSFKAAADAHSQCLMVNQVLVLSSTHNLASGLENQAQSVQTQTSTFMTKSQSYEDTDLTLGLTDKPENHTSHSQERYSAHESFKSTLRLILHMLLVLHMSK